MTYLHRRSGSTDSAYLFKVIKSGDIVRGSVDEESLHCRNNTQVSLPCIVGPKNHDLQANWLTRSNRLLEIINRTSEVVADMEKSKNGFGYYKISPSHLSGSSKRLQIRPIESLPKKPALPSCNSSAKITERLLTMPNIVDEPQNCLRQRIINRVESIKGCIAIDADRINIKPRQKSQSSEKLCEKSIKLRRPKRHLLADQIARHAAKYPYNPKKLSLVGAQPERICPWAQNSPQKLKQSHYDFF